MYFVYELIDPRDESVFYIGKGKGNRPSAHTREARAGVRSAKCERIRAILADGYRVAVHIAERFVDEAAAYAAEIERIAEIGLDNLTNVLPGGGGVWRRYVQARRVVNSMPRTMILCIAKLLGMAQAGYVVRWGGFNVTEFAKSSMGKLIEDHGVERVSARFTECGCSLVTG